MKTYKFLSLTIAALFCVVLMSAQTAEEIVDKYLNAMGGKDQISKVTSLYMEGSLDVMGSQGTVKTTQVNGKGYKQEIEVMGTSVIMCYNDSMGWQINPMAGNYSAEKMPDGQYLSGKDQLYIGGPFMTDYVAKGYKLELVGQEMTGMVNAHKIKVISPDNTESFYYFDPESGYLVKMVQNAEMGGQAMEIIITMSNYQKPENGFSMPYSMETNYGGQFFLVANITKVEINKEIDLAVFAKPE